MNKEKEEVLVKLRDVKNTATEDILKSGDRQNEVVQNVKYYGNVKLKRRDSKEIDSMELYIVEIYDYQSDKIENKIYLDGQEVDIGELIRTYKDIDPIKDIINKAKENQEKGENAEEYSLNELEEEKVREYAELTGKEEQEIEEVDELDLKQRLKEKEEEELDIENTSNLTRKEETSLEQRIKGTTLRNALGLTGEYVKIAIVSSSQVNKYITSEKRHNNIDSFIAIKANGESMVLGEDIIRQDRQEGINSTAVDLTANIDGKINYEKNTSSYQLVKTPNLYIKVGYDENLGKEIKIEDRARGKGNEGMVYELETSSTWRADDDVRRMQRDNEGVYAANKAIDKQKEHERFECENDRVENIDEYKENDLHEHYEIKENDKVPGKEITFKEWANELGEGTDKLIERFQREIHRNPKESPKDITEDIENDYDRLPQHKR